MKWKPFTTIPKNRELLIVWGNTTDGPEGYDIVKYLKSNEGGDDMWESTNENIYPNKDNVILAWMDLPEFPYKSAEPKKPENFKPYGPFQNY
jgi:hypothetical protein